jgi:hypothetical protein
VKSLGDSLEHAGRTSLADEPMDVEAMPIRGYFDSYPAEEA